VLVSTESEDNAQPSHAAKNERNIKAREEVEIRCDVLDKPCLAGRYNRFDLQPGDYLKGPVLITEPQTTTFVARDFEATVDALGNICLARIAEAL